MRARVSAEDATSFSLARLLRSAESAPFGFRASSSSTSRERFPIERSSRCPNGGVFSNLVSIQRRTFSRWAQTEPTLEGTDGDLWARCFQPFGVSKEQFKDLIGHGARYRVAPNTHIVRGGQEHTKLAIIINGEAIAYTVKDGVLGNPVCRYIGRCTDRCPESSIPPVRGSVIGGSAIIDEDVQKKPFPSDIVAKLETEYIEWDLQRLREFIDRPYYRSVQASFYHLLYKELLVTLVRDQQVKALYATSSAKTLLPKESVTKNPSTRQLLSLAAFVAVPFCGFGFADNAIMIVCGDIIDAHFGTMLGLTTLAAAGLGNWISDVVGLGLGDAIERWASRMGLSNGNLSPAQEKLQRTKITVLMSRIIGISIGCFAGMIPLLFLTPTKQEFTNEDLALFDTVFRPCGATTTQFTTLMESGKRHQAREGQVIVQGGVQQEMAVLLLHGQATAYDWDEDAQKHRGAVAGRYVGRLDPPDPMVSDVRGSIIGGSLIAGEVEQTHSYPRSVVAASPVEWVEWDITALQAVMDHEKSIQASFLSIIYGDAVTQLRENRTNVNYKTYSALVMAVSADGVVSDAERELLAGFKKQLGISEEEHFAIISEEGWTVEGWNYGSMSLPSPQALGDQNDDADDAAKLESVAELLKDISKRIGSCKPVAAHPESKVNSATPTLD